MTQNKKLISGIGLAAAFAALALGGCGRKADPGIASIPNPQGTWQGGGFGCPPGQVRIGPAQCAAGDFQSRCRYSNGTLTWGANGIPICEVNVPVMQNYYWGNLTPRQFPILNAGNPAGSGAFETGLPVRPGDRLCKATNATGGYGTQHSGWFQYCAITGVSSALLASDGTSTYPLSFNSYSGQRINGSGTLKLGFDVANDGVDRCWYISPQIFIRHCEDANGNAVECSGCYSSYAYPTPWSGGWGYYGGYRF
jgi:hypothetical protein